MQIQDQTLHYKPQRHHYKTPYSHWHGLLSLANDQGAGWPRAGETGRSAMSCEHPEGKASELSGNIE